MKAVRLNELGGPEKLHVEEVADPQPGPGQIVVKISRAAFNRRDVFITQGLYPGIELPKTLGSDGTGVVAALGSGVSGPALGTAVVIDPQIGWSDTLGHAHKGASLLGMPLGWDVCGIRGRAGGERLQEAGGLERRRGCGDSAGR